MSRLCTPLKALVLTVALVNPGFAQNPIVGVKAGISFADLGADVEDVIETGTDLRTGISVGGFLGVDLDRLFRLQGEVQYVEKGATASSQGIDADFRLSYLEVLIPLTLIIPMEGAVLRPRLYAGPSVAYEMSCDIELKGEGASLEFDCENAPPDADIEIESKNVDFGVFVGGGIDIPAGPGAVSIDILYNLGLSDIDDLDPDIDVRNRNIQVLAGYGLSIGP